MEEVYIIFEETQRSCDRDYGDDGFMIIWDSDEVGRNMSTSELMKEVERIDDETYDELVNHLIEEYKLIPTDIQTLDNNYFEEVFEFLEKKLGDSGFYRFYYQNILCVREVHKTEESAKKQVEYYTNNHSYQNKYSYSKYNVHELGGQD